MGSCYLGVHIAGDHIHTDTGVLKHVLLETYPHPLLLQWFETIGCIKIS